MCIHKLIQSVIFLSSFTFPSCYCLLPVVTSNFHSFLALMDTVSLLLSHSISLTFSLSAPPSSPSVSLLPLSAVSPLISPVQSPGRHMPSVCRASRDASCAGVPQSMHNRYGEHGERGSFGTMSRADWVWHGEYTGYPDRYGQ